VRVSSSEEILEDFEGISTESIGLLAHEVTTRNTVLEDLLTVPVVGFSELSY
jgi:hypothetical protein